MKCRFVFFLWLVACAHAFAPDSVFNLEPAKEYPRNCEGSFVTLKHGCILICYS